MSSQTRWFLSLISFGLIVARCHNAGSGAPRLEDARQEESPIYAGDRLSQSETMTDGQVLPSFDAVSLDSISDIQPQDATSGSLHFEAPARSVTAKCAVVCAVLANGTVYCWGRGTILNNGGVGFEQFSPRRILGFREIEQFSNSCDVGCGVDRNQDVWCFGSNYVNLRTGSTDTYLTQARRRLDVNHITQVAMWSAALLARHEDGSLYLRFGTPPDLMRFSLPAPVIDVRASFEYCVALVNGRIACSDPNAPTAAPLQVEGIDNVVAVAPGYSHSCVLKRDGTVWCWGRNDFGETGTPPESSDQCAGQTFPDERGNLVRPFHACVRQPRQVTGLTEVVELGVAEGRSCVRKRDGTVWCWGGNTGGVLGDGLPPSEVCPSVAWDPPRFTPAPTPCRRRPSQVSGLSEIISLAVADGFACAVESNGQVWCWGGNNEGSLGTGDRISSSVPVLVPASALRRDL